MCVCSEGVIYKARESAKSGVPSMLFVGLKEKPYKSYFGMSILAESVTR